MAAQVSPIMIATPLVRKLFLTVHVVASVGWLGAVSAFLCLAVTGLVSSSPDLVAAAYVAMNVIGLYAVVPFALAALASGLLQALTTPWGLLQHYWVLSKLLLTLLASGLVLLHQATAVAPAAELALAAPSAALPAVGRLGAQLVMDAGLAIGALLTAVTLAVLKPRGLTVIGRRKLVERLGQEAAATSRDTPAPGRWVFIAVIAAIVLVFAFVHFTGMAGHGGH